MISKILLALRILLVLTLIPVWALLAYFVHICNPSDGDAFSSALYLFVVAFVSTVWCVALAVPSPLLRWNPWVPILIDLSLCAIISGGVYLLDPFARNTECKGLTSYGELSGHQLERQCYMYKCAYALAMLDAILFFIVAVGGLAACKCGKKGEDEEQVSGKVELPEK